MAKTRTASSKPVKMHHPQQELPEVSVNCLRSSLILIDYHAGKSKAPVKIGPPIKSKVARGKRRMVPVNISDLPGEPYIYHSQKQRDIVQSEAVLEKLGY